MAGRGRETSTRGSTPATRRGTGAGRAPSARAAGVRGYLQTSRDEVNAWILVAPVFVAYQIGILFTGGVMNGADFFTLRLLGALQGDVVVYSAINLAILAVFVGMYLWRRADRRLGGSTFPYLLMESTVWAMVLGYVVSGTLLRIGFEPPGMAGLGVVAGSSAEALALGPLDALILSLGAGAYEELFFRFLLMGGMYRGLRWGGVRETWSWVVAVGVSSVIFSAFHYVPIGMESWETWSFLFRLLMGVLFAILYVVRGFAVAVYTHAIYDILILVPRALSG